MRKNVFIISMLAGAVLLTSCASKKDLENCQNEKRELIADFQNTKEDLAASRSRVASLEEQLAQVQRDYAALQGALDKSLTNANQNNISIEKLVDQINESNQYIRHLVAVKTKSDSLNVVLTNNLTRYEQRRAQGSRCAGAQRRGLHIAGRQHALQERLV